MATYPRSRYSDPRGYATEPGPEEVVKLLVNRGATKHNTADQFGKTPFMYARMRGLGV